FPSPLPIELISFSLNSINTREVELKWVTATEKDNDYFSVERSQTGQDWEVITYISGAGTSSEMREYSIIDVNTLSGVSYYRLKQTDYDGTSTYSDILSYNQKTEQLGIT